jgi:SAM-dependent methyltransferase
MERPILNPDRLVELGYAFRGAKVLMSAVELGVFTALGQSAADVDELRTRLGLNKRGARDFFDALVALGLLRRNDDGRYANSPEADLYLDRGKTSYVGGFLENLNAREYGMWRSLTEALRTGKPQTGFESKAHYEALYSHPERLESFVRGMTGWTVPVGKAIASKFPWREHRTVIDIGGAQGALPVEIAQAHGHIAGGGFDLPALKPMFERYAGDHGLAQRLHFYAGDFFADPLPTADVLVMGRVLHNWDLATKRMLLAKAHDALRPGGALIVYDRLIDDDRREPSGLLSSLNMLLMTDGGFDFTAADCIGWMREAGFHDMRVEPLVAGQSMVVAKK